MPVELGEWIGNGAFVEMVMVDFRESAISGVEIYRNGIDCKNPDVWRKEGVEREAEPIGIRERSVSKWAVWPRAWTPASVRLEPVRSRGWRRAVWSAF